MCTLGDIIIVIEFKNELGQKIKKHSFVVINDKNGKIEGMNYDFISNMICSFHDIEHKKRKLSFKENLELNHEKVISNNANDKDGFIKVDQLYYFDKSKIDYYIFGKIIPEFLNELSQLLLMLTKEGKVKKVKTNIEDYASS